MRIGIDITPLTARRSGIGNYVAHLLRELVQIAAGDEFAGLSVGRRPVDPGDRPAGMRTRHVPIPARVMYRVWNALGAPSVDALLGGLDVYHATNFFLPPVRRARKVLSIPDASFVVVPELCSPKIVGPFARSVGRFAHEADAVITISESSKRDIVEHFGVAAERVTVTYPGPGVVAGETDVGAIDEIGKPYILFVSTLEPRKNVTGLIAAFERAASAIPHDLVLAGQFGWKTGPIREAMANSPHAARIRHVGFVDDRALAALYRNADLFVFPSFYEGFGLPVLEAMAYGCPVITANNSALPEVGGDAAVYVDARDHVELAETIVRLLNDESERVAMAERGRVQAEKFTWRACAETTLAAYRG
jgi:glycosyltransferase involved in cell wall biosynthesis